MRFSLVVAVVAIVASGCTQTAQKQPASRQELIAQMIRNPYTREMGMAMWYQDMGLVPPGYPGNCPTDYHRDAAGNRCGGRSAMSRPGGY